MEIYGELGRVPLMVLRLCRIIKYWLKITKSKSYLLIKALYNVQLSTINTDGTRVNCVSKVRDLLCTYGFGEAWFNQGLVMLMLFKISFVYHVYVPDICIYKTFIVIYKTVIKRYFIDI